MELQNLPAAGWELPIRIHTHVSADAAPRLFHRAPPCHCVLHLSQLGLKFLNCGLAACINVEYVNPPSHQDDVGPSWR